MVTAPPPLLLELLKDRQHRMAGFLVSDGMAPCFAKVRTIDEIISQVKYIASMTFLDSSIQHELCL